MRKIEMQWKWGQSPDVQHELWKGLEAWEDAGAGGEMKGVGRELEVPADNFIFDVARK